MSNPRVYISYTWHTRGMKQKALRMAEKLRAAGIDSRIDLFCGKSLHGFTPPPPKSPRDAWDHWQEEQVKLADRVILFCTAEYATASPDSGVARDLKYMKSDLATGARDPSKFVPVGFGFYPANEKFMPDFIRGATYYDVGSPQ